MITKKQLIKIDSNARYFHMILYGSHNIQIHVQNRKSKAALPYFTISCSNTLPSFVSLMSPEPDTNLTQNKKNINQQLIYDAAVTTPLFTIG